MVILSEWDGLAVTVVFSSWNVWMELCRNVKEMVDHQLVHLLVLLFKVWWIEWAVLLSLPEWNTETTSCFEISFERKEYNRYHILFVSVNIAQAAECILQNSWYLSYPLWVIVVVGKGRFSLNLSGISSYKFWVIFREEKGHKTSCGCQKFYCKEVW
jgi:hypothetical protein